MKSSMDTSLEPRVLEMPGLHNKIRVFEDRAHAGRILSELLMEFREQDALVLAIPAGGVPVAKVLADLLGLPLEVAVVKKITPPWNSEFGYGAVAFDGTLQLNEDFLGPERLGEEEIQRGISAAKEKVKQRLHKFRGHKPFPTLKGRTVLLVDDGLATGFTLLTAVQAARNGGANKIVIAVPTAHRESLKKVSARVDHIVCPNVREGFSFAVADAYENWYDVTDEEVSSLLN